MNRQIERLVRARANGVCEYCRFPEDWSELQFVIDHIIAKQHLGGSRAENLALACVFCNRHKGPNVGGVDPRTWRHARLFHPRKDRWRDHFRWRSEKLTGLTGIGRATIIVLAMNQNSQLRARRTLIRDGLFPPR
jgi:HNH endonuclease